jgi:hypothetical protein
VNCRSFSKPSSGVVVPHVLMIIVCGYTNRLRGATAIRRAHQNRDNAISRTGHHWLAVRLQGRHATHARAADGNKFTK